MSPAKYDPYFTELKKIEDFLAKIKKHVPSESIPAALKKDYLETVRATKALRHYGKIIYHASVKTYLCFRGRYAKPCPETQLPEDGPHK